MPYRQACGLELSVWGLAALVPGLQLDSDFPLAASEALEHPWLLTPAEQLELASLVLPAVQVPSHSLSEHAAGCSGQGMWAILLAAWSGAQRDTACRCSVLACRHSFLACSAAVTCL